jgi:hypothetical protein
MCGQNECQKRGIRPKFIRINKKMKIKFLKRMWCLAGYNQILIILLICYVFSGERSASEKCGDFSITFPLPKHIAALISSKNR